MDMRCSAVARVEGFPTVGTAGDQRGFLLVDWPLPWPADIAAIAELAPVHEAARQAGVRVQAVVPHGGTARVVLYRRPDGPGFAGYDRTASVAPAAGVVEAALALLAMELLADPAVRDAGYAVGRTSHTGGHRFAPTAIVLPQGTMWAHLDRGTVARILRRTGPVADVLALYRGSTGIGAPALQALERHAFAEIGWGWLDWRREGREVSEGVVALAGDAPTGERAAWEAVVTSRARPVPDCGKPLAEARKESPEPVIVAWRRTA